MDPAPTSALPIALSDLLYNRGVEAARVEFKSGWNEGPTAQQVLATICAFANDYYNVNGGYIVLGVEERNGLAQLPPKGLDPGEIERIQRWIRGNCNRLEPVYHPILSPEVVDGRHLLVIWAFGSPNRPHSTPGERAGERRFWVRLGADTVEARGPVLAELHQMTRWVPFDDQPAPAFTVNDLRSTLVRELLQEVRSGLVDEPDDREMYRALQLLHRMNGHEVPRNVALLFFADSPERAFPGARIDVVRFQDDAGGDVLEERIFRGPLHRQVRDCLNYLHNLAGQLVLKHPDRPEATTLAAWPAAAIDEAVVNAVHHRDYRHEQQTTVFLYPTEMVITSYPGPVPGLKPEDFAPGRRIPRVPARNRRIGELLKELKLAETRSTGVPKIFKAMRDNGSPEPSFEFDEGRSYFSVVLPIHPTFLKSVREAASDDFLARVEAVCRLREPDSEIERLASTAASGDYLRVSRRRGLITETFPVGAVENEFSAEHLRAFIAEVDAPYRRADPGLISVLVYGGKPVDQETVRAAAAMRVQVTSFIEYQGLIDFRLYLQRQTARLASDPLYPPRLYVPQRMRVLSLLGGEEAWTGDALAEVRAWLDSPHGRFLLILGDFGTGKTFLLHELARRMGEAAEGPVPILLQMRSLEKGRSLDALLAQHFAQEGMEGFSPSKFRYMLEQGRVALLFDGFDELALRVTYDRAAEHFDTLLQAATGAAKVVVTSRRQHFLSEAQVKTVLAEKVESLSGHRLGILQAFSREQVRQFLLNMFQGDARKAEERLELIDRVKDLPGLSSNPRLLGFIADLPEAALIAAGQDGEITAAKLYHVLLDRWLARELDRVHPRGAPPGLSVEDRWRAVTALALRLWQKTERSASEAELEEEVARTVRTPGPALDSKMAAFQVGSGTLLVRDEEGGFSFLHESILEWLVARSAALDVSEGREPSAFREREISPLLADFFVGLAGRDHARSWAQRILAGTRAEIASKNASLVLDRLGLGDRVS